MITLGEFKKFLAICGYPQAGGGVTAGKPSAVLAQRAVAVPHTGDTNEFTHATIAIPAGAMGVNGSIRVLSRWTIPNTANNKTLRVRFAGTDFLGYVATTSASVEVLTVIQNRGVANSQIGDRLAVSAAIGASAAVFVTSAIDTSVAQNLTLTGQLANTGETITLESYTVEILNP